MLATPGCRPSFSMKGSQRSVFSSCTLTLLSKTHRYKTNCNTHKKAALAAGTSLSVRKTHAVQT